MPAPVSAPGILFARRTVDRRRYGANKVAPAACYCVGAAVGAKSPGCLSEAVGAMDGAWPAAALEHGLPKAFVLLLVLLSRQTNLHNGEDGSI